MEESISYDKGFWSLLESTAELIDLGRRSAVAEKMSALATEDYLEAWAKKEASRRLALNF